MNVTIRQLLEMYDETSMRHHVGESTEVECEGHTHRGSEEEGHSHEKDHTDESEEGGSDESDNHQKHKKECTITEDLPYVLLQDNDFVRKRRDLNSLARVRKRFRLAQKYGLTQE